MTTEYRGYRIKITRADKLTALIWAPKVLQCLDIQPTATLREGERVVTDRAHAEIDKLESSGAATKVAIGGSRRF